MPVCTIKSQWDDLSIRNTTHLSDSVRILVHLTPSLATTRVNILFWIIVQESH